MASFDCERCGIGFKTKQILVKHLNKQKICIAIYNDIAPKKLIDNLNKKQGIKCTECDKLYKNDECLRVHKIRTHTMSKDKPINTDNKIEKLENKINELTSIILELAKNPHIVNNIDNSTTNNNTINITLNCLMDTSGKPIEYLLNREDIVDKILGWMKLNQKLISTYMKEKYYNIEHPENQMIRAGKTDDNIELYIGGKWRNYENVKGADMILTNIGNDFGIFLEILKDNPELYTDKKKLVKQFEKDIIKPLNWGLESSEDTANDIDFQLIKNVQGEYVRDDDNEERIKREGLQSKVINHIHKDS
jgi:hypothetical protein